MAASRLERKTVYAAAETLRGGEQNGPKDLMIRYLGFRIVALVGLYMEEETDHTLVLGPWGRGIPQRAPYGAPGGF